MIADDPRSQMLFEMGQCAYRLGMVFGAEAERAMTHERRLEFFQLFDRCAFAARMSVALELRLQREARAGRAIGREAAERDPTERQDRDPSETETYAAPDIEAEADRERERASLPVLLRTLDQVADAAQALPGPPPAALPTLRELLARVAGEPRAPMATPHGRGPRPSDGGALRARLAGSTTTLTRPSPPGPPLRPGLPAGLSLRRATGPPR